MQNYNHNMPTGCLYIVSTPIGNLKDITYRAVETLKQVDAIFCENPKNSAKLLDAYGIKNKTYRYHDYSDEKTRGFILQLLQSGKNLALISDAGTPMISDPGYKLLISLKEHNITITPIPGACAFITALSASAMPTNELFFGGFLSTKKSKLQEQFEQVKDYNITSVFYESPKRIYKSICLLNEIMGNRKVLIARELTKLFEEFIHIDSSSFIEKYKDHNFKGEIVLAIMPESTLNKDFSDADLSEIIKDNLQEGKSIKDTVKYVMEVTKASKGKIYKLALDLKKSINS